MTCEYRFRVGMVALCLAVIGCSRGKDGGAGSKPIAWSPVVPGLAPEHTTQTPFLEKVYCAPRTDVRTADCLTSRVYEDGALYYLAPSKDRWNAVGRVSSKGVQELQGLYASLCGKQDPVLANDSGSEVHRVRVPGCSQEFVVTGVASGDLAPISQSTVILNRSMVPGSAPRVHP
ncbi:MAG: hypothetical protein HY898_30005 [Deltaproteobacteria bacterium]|nr:hypothetical protein [Deltaproteobacteria bacterium]